MMRLDRYLANAGIGTRKEVKKIIQKGMIKVDHVICTKPNVIIDEVHTDVMYQDKKIYYQKFHYLMLHKPQNYISSTQDEQYPSILQLIHEDYAKLLFPVGRLDVDTEGLLLLTNDGALAHSLLSPKKKVAKRYYAELKYTIQDEQILHLTTGITLDDGPCLPCKVFRIHDKAIEMILYEGRFHQVKRMLHAVNNEVIFLKRTEMGPISLDPTLALGQYRLLSEEEICLLKGEK